jgi:hypothetical protein
VASRDGMKLIIILCSTVALDHAIHAAYLSLSLCSESSRVSSYSSEYRSCNRTTLSDV